MKKRDFGAIAALAMLAACGGGGDSPTAAAATADADKTNAATVPAKMRKGYYAFDDGPVEEITFEDRDGQAVLEGDIVLGRTEDILQRPSTDRVHAEGIYVTNKSRWPSGVVVYTQPNLSSSNVYADAFYAMRHISLHTRVRFSRTLSYAASFKPNDSQTIYDMVSFYGITDPNLGGSSAVGRVGGLQTVSINTNEAGIDGASVATHELLHAIGAWHEQSRGDRDSYITVNTANAIPTYISNFDKHTSDGAMFGGYDYCSAMHYGPLAFSNPPAYLETMHALQPVSCQVFVAYNEGTATWNNIGQRSGLSAGDIAMVNGLYASAQADRPYVYAGADQHISSTVASSNPVTVKINLDGSASQAVGGASIAKYSWKPSTWTANSCQYPPCPGNPLGSFTGPTANTSVTLAPNQRSGTFQYDLTVTDTLGRVMTDTVTVGVSR